MSGPIRGLHDVEGQLFAVSGRTLYQISNKKVAIPLGTIPGVGRVSMAHNQRSTGNELIVVNGSGGYVWNTATQEFKVVTDEGYPGASVVDFIDGYLMQVEPFGRFLFHSNLADALDYNTLDRFEAETAPDRTLGMIVNHQEVWAFGERTIDVFGNAGTAQGTFQNKGVSISRGCAAKWSPAVIDNGVAWMGDDLKVYHAVGYGPVRISTRAIEVALSECSRTDLRNAFSFVWEDLSHAVYYLTVPNGPTFGYDFSTGLWHRRASWHPERDISGRWRINDLVRHNGRWIGGDYQTGKLYELDWDYMMEGCDPLVRERVSPVAHNDGHGFTVESVEAFFDTGGKETACVEFPTQPQGPSISGSAPDSFGVAPYTFQYASTPGSAPIARTVLIDTTLPDGWAWNELTATISNPSPTGDLVIALKMRVYDSNGLHGDHEDEFVVARETKLLVTGTSLVGGGPLMAMAIASGLLEFSGIPQASGANVANCIPAYYGGVWCAVGGQSCRYHEGDAFDSWQSSALPLTPLYSAITLAGGPAGWVVCGGRTSAGGIVKSPPVPTSFSEYHPSIVSGGSPVGTMAAAQVACYLDSYYFNALRSTAGNICATADMAGAVDLVYDVVGNNTLRPFYDLALFNGELYAASKWGFSVGRIQLVSSPDGGATWGDPILDFDGGVTPELHPYQLAAGVNAEGDEVLLVLCLGGRYVWTSADGFSEPHATGIATTQESPAALDSTAKRIVFAWPNFYIVSGAHSDPEQANKCVTTRDGITFSAPVTIPLANVRGIATNYEASDE